jgi:hypothetical protein
MNDTVDGSFIPYFLTAHHCLSTSASAASLEAFWDFRAPCGGLGNRNNSPRSNGASLLATKSTSDFTLLRLKSIPGGRVFLGWNATLDAIPNGTKLYRLSHPGINGQDRPQTYSTSTLDIRAIERADAPATHYLYSKPLQGGVYFGSSGAPTINAEGQVLGQLLGPNRNVPDVCTHSYHQVDGAFARTLENVRRFLAPAQLDRSSCRADSTTVCLSSNRFEVKASYRFSNGQSGNLKLSKYTNNTVLGYYSDRNNIEVMAKVLDGCTLNGTFWAFIGGVTDQHVFMRIRDTRTGIIQSYSNSLGRRFGTVADTSAFPCN